MAGNASSPEETSNCFPANKSGNSHIYSLSPDTGSVIPGSLSRINNGREDIHVSRLRGTEFRFFKKERIDEAWKWLRS
jgi:hypothetical protein